MKKNDSNIALNAKMSDNFTFIYFGIDTVRK